MHIQKQYTCTHTYRCCWMFPVSSGLLRQSIIHRHWSSWVFGSGGAPNFSAGKLDDPIGFHIHQLPLGFESPGESLGETNFLIKLPWRNRGWIGWIPMCCACLGFLAQRKLMNVARNWYAKRLPKHRKCNVVNIKETFSRCTGIPRHRRLLQTVANSYGNDT